MVRPRFSLVSAGSAVKFGGGVWMYQASIRIPMWSDIGDTFTARFGFGDKGDEGPDSGLFILYSHGINGGDWRLAGMESGSPTPPDDTEVPVTTSWTTLQIEVNEEGEATFYVNGAIVGTLEAIGGATGLLPIQIERSVAGEGASRSVEIDYYRYTFRPAVRGSFYPQ